MMTRGDTHDYRFTRERLQSDSRENLHVGPKPPVAHP